MDKSDVNKAQQAAKLLRQSIDKLKVLGRQEGGKSATIVSELDQLSKLDPLDPKTEGKVQEFIDKISK